MSYAIRRDDGRLYRGGRWWRWTRFDRFASVHPTPEMLFKFIAPKLHAQGVKCQVVYWVSRRRMRELDRARLLIEREIARAATATTFQIIPPERTGEEDGFDRIERDAGERWAGKVTSGPGRLAADIAWAVNGAVVERDQQWCDAFGFAFMDPPSARRAMDALARVTDPPQQGVEVSAPGKSAPSPSPSSPHPPSGA